jgi:hypothetical protein
MCFPSGLKSKTVSDRELLFVGPVKGAVDHGRSPGLGQSSDGAILDKFCNVEIVLVNVGYICLASGENLANMSEDASASPPIFVNDLEVSI